MPDQNSHDELAARRRTTVAVSGGVTITAPTPELAREEAARIDRARTFEAQRLDRWGSDDVEQMRRLCDGFPSLRGVPGTAPWDANTFLKWALTPACTSGSWHAALFVLQVWNHDTDWCEAACGLGLLDASAEGFTPFKPFNVAQALVRWDAEHAAAFRSWCELPFFP